MPRRRGAGEHWVCGAEEDATARGWTEVAIAVPFRRVDGEVRPEG